MKGQTLPIRLGTAALLVAVLLSSAGCAAKPTPTPTPTKTPRPTFTPTAAKPTRTPTPLVPSATPTPLAPPTATPLPPTSTKSGIRYVCAGGDGVYVRSRPDLEAGVKAWSDGTEMMVLDQEGDWYKVQAPDNYIGYVPAKYLCLVRPALSTATPVPLPPAATPNPANTFRITLFAACPQPDQAEIVANVVGEGGRLSGFVLVLTNHAGGQYVSDPSTTETQWVQYPCAAVPAQYERKLYNVKLNLTATLRGQKGDWVAYVAQSKDNLAPLSPETDPISFVNGGRYFIDFQHQ